MLRIIPIKVPQNGLAPMYMIIQPHNSNNNVQQKICNPIQFNNSLPLNSPSKTNGLQFQYFSNVKQFNTPTNTYRLPIGQQLPVIQYIPLQTKPMNTFSVQQRENIVEDYKNPFNYESIETNKYKNKCKLEERDLLVNKTVTTVWSCLICTNDYNEKCVLLDHYETHKKVCDQLEDNVNNDQEKNLDCPICGKHNKNVQTYRNHAEKHGPKELYCNICKHNYSNNYYLSIHMAKHSKDPHTFVCVVCKNFSTKSSLDLGSHIDKKHAKDMFSCEECGKDFISESWFNDHKVFHLKLKNFQCDKCKIFYNTERLFINHMKKSHLIKIDAKFVKFKCFKCDLTFPQKRNFILHNQKIHPKPDTFLCNVCGQAFPFQRPLTEHMKIHEKRQYMCSTCGKTFAKNQTLALHRRIHTGEKPNKCKICGKCFTQKSTLNIHLRMHSGERPYPCDKCKKGFITKTTRDIHQKSCKKIC